MVTSTVQGGAHHGASFIPTNGVAARTYVEQALARLREQGITNPRGRFLDDHHRRHHRRKSDAR